MIKKEIYEQALFDTIKRGATEISPDVRNAFEDAIERARQLADRITRKCMEGSIAAIVDDIEKGEI